MGFRQKQKILSEGQRGFHSIISCICYELVVIEMTFPNVIFRLMNLKVL